MSDCIIWHGTVDGGYGKIGSQRAHLPRLPTRGYRAKEGQMTTELAIADRADDAVVTGVDDGQPELTEVES